MTTTPPLRTLLAALRSHWRLRGTMSESEWHAKLRPLNEAYRKAQEQRLTKREKR